MDASEEKPPSNYQPSLDSYRSRIERALAYLQANLGGDLSLDGAAAAACFSKYHFHRIFSAALGESFADYLRRIRLDRAANLLEQRPGMTVTQAALASGFASPSVLSRLFSERFGLPPSSWRTQRLAATRAARGAPALGAPASPSLWSGLARGQARPTAIEIRPLPALRFASFLHIGPYGPGVEEAWRRLYAWAGPRGLLGPAARTAGISWDNPELCPPVKCRYSAALLVSEEERLEGAAVPLSFPARTYLCLRYKGLESGFAAAYDELYRRHLPESGFEPEDDPAIELYRGPMGEEFDLDIALPVRPLA